MNMSYEALNSMLIFAEDFMDAKFVDYPDEHGFQSAMARFRTVEGAHEARSRLHGKLNSTNDANMFVEMLHSNVGSGHSSFFEGNDSGLRRQLSNPHSLHRSSTTGSAPRRPSRYFQSMGEKLSPIKIPNNGHENEHPNTDTIFNQQSPRGAPFRDGMRVTGKSMINEDADEDTGELLKDPIAYAQGGHSGSLRRSNSSALPPVSRLASLSLNTADQASNPMMGHSGSGFGANNGRTMAPLGSPTSEGPNAGLNNGATPMSPNGGFPLSPQQLQRQHHYPPANPADQNPPCNTLYVGNLPVDTSEDELKAMFSKQRGYKRLCFRTKHNGPMCFVEFEDVSFATKALNELYGQPLHNSVKGGIRLSFSKNPLGVRTGQANSMNPTSPLGSPNGGAGLGGSLGAPPGFSTASGPPPGLAAPPGLTSPSSAANSGSGTSNGYGGFFGQSSPPFSGNSNGHSAGRNQPNNYLNNSTLSSVGGGFSDSIAGR